MRELKFWTLPILFFLKIFSVEADYRLEVRAHTYSNPRGIDSRGFCCNIFNPPPCLPNKCEPQFIFCLRKSGIARDSDPSNCSLGISRPSKQLKADQVEFPQSFDFSFTGELWPGGFQLLVNIEDAQVGTDHAVNLIDDIYVEERFSPGQSITRRAYTGAFSIATITLSISLTCTSGFGPNCDDQCPPLSAPDNGVMDQPSTISEGSIATYTCNEGYDLVGDSTQTCQSSGVWSGSPPICQPGSKIKLSIALAVAVPLFIGVIIGTIVLITVCTVAKKHRPTTKELPQSGHHNYESHSGPPTLPYRARPLPLCNQDNTALTATGYLEISLTENPVYSGGNKTGANIDNEDTPYYSQISN